MRETHEGIYELNKFCLVIQRNEDLNLLKYASYGIASKLLVERCSHDSSVLINKYVSLRDVNHLIF